MNKITRFFAEHALFLVIGAISLVALILIIIVFTLASSVNAPRNLTISDISGSAFILKNDGQIAADKNMRLESGDVLITSSDSSVKLSVDKDKSVYIQSDTTLYVNYTDVSEKGSVIVNISEGSVICRLDSKLSKDEAFEVRTPNAVVSAAGTVFRTSFEYFDTYSNHTEVKLTDVDCAEGNVNIQLYDNNAAPCDNLMLLAEGKSARLMTCADVSRFLYLNSDTDMSGFSEDILKDYIRIAAGRKISYSLSDLNAAYQNMLNGGLMTETEISTSYPIQSETEPTVTTPAASTQTSAQTVVTTAPAEAVGSTAISVTSPTTKVYTVSGSQTSAITSDTPSQTVTTAPPTVTTQSETQTVAPIRPAESVTQTTPVQTEAATTTTSDTTTSSETTTTSPTVPWWEIINSSALTRQAD